MVQNICLVRLPFATSLNQNENNNLDGLCIVSIFGSHKQKKECVSITVQLNYDLSAGLTRV